MSKAIASPTTMLAGRGSDTDKQTRRSVAVQIDKDLGRMVAVIASHDGVTQSDVISPFLRPHVLAHYERVQKEIRAEIETLQSKPK